MCIRNFCHAGVAVLVLAGCGEAFNFETASPDEKQSWMASYGASMNDGFRDGLRSSDALKYFYVMEPEINVSSRRITLVAKFKSADAGLKGASTARQKLIDGICPIYLKGDLDENNVAVRLKIQRSNGLAILTAEFNPSSCASFVQGA